MNPVPSHVDVLIIGAGISGICAAHYLQRDCPDLSFAIVEARDRLGGTWDLFRYPGIRSDSDMYTLGFSFRPWRNPKAIADGPSILAYLDETARETGIGEHIRYGLRVERVSWSTEEARWTAHLRRATGEELTITCGFLWVCAGYYRYDQGYTPEFPGIERFGGRVVHPQHWPADLDVAGKRVVVIGSGATAVTLAPELAKAGAQVTMLQRSPTYIVSAPSEDAVAERFKAWLSPSTAHQLVRWKNILAATTLYQFCQRFPRAARRLIRSGVRRGVGDEAIVDAHFNPTYDPWDQRLCLVPDGDLFQAIVGGGVTLVTDRIASFTDKGVELCSGDVLEADIVVTATGLALQFLGGASVEVDGRTVELPSTRMYMGAMLSDVPNVAFVLGYTNASWTLKCELVCEYIARLLRHMRDHGYIQAVPRWTEGSVEDRPAIEMSSGYFQRATHLLPRKGSHAPWLLHQNYLRDRWMYRRSRFDDGVLELTRPAADGRPAR
jgi:cation diffusion facilitator CzcD-associated flavoprotein CzcO